MDPFDPAADDSTRGRKPATLPEGKARYARVFASYGGARVTARMQLRKAPGGRPTEFGKIIRLHERIKNYTNRAQGTLPAGKELMALGDSLFKTLLTGRVQRLYDEARARQHGGKLDLVLTSMVSWIAEKPWEFAYDAERKRFLATEDVNFIRNVLTSIPSDAVKQDEKCLRILVVCAQPLELARLDVAQEITLIRRGFESLERQGLAKIDILPRATPEKLHRRLSVGKYSVVHFIGHGEFDASKQEGALLFETAEGTARPLSGAYLRQIFCGRGLSLVFLNACLSGTGGRGADFNKGVAQSLVEQGLPALVANQYSVLDTSATSFAQHFYWSLAQGFSLGRAAREARIAVNLDIDGEIIDWAVPVVYAREPGMILCAPRKVRRAKPKRAAIIRTKAAHKHRVAVWDMDNTFPDLPGTLKRMSAVQTMFGFELTTMSVPLGVWDLEYQSPDSTPYLWAEKLAQRLHSKSAEINADVLACITRHWLADDDTLNLYGWWPDSPTPPVVIYSCAGFDRLPAQGSLTDRVIANVIVSALAGFYAGVGSHEKGSKDCPLYYNEERDFDLIAAVQQFDPDCRKKLRRKDATLLTALDQLLHAFSGARKKPKAN
jgi:CHAT domain